MGIHDPNLVTMIHVRRAPLPTRTPEAVGLPVVDRHVGDFTGHGVVGEVVG